jgi:hypothetical protein
MNKQWFSDRITTEKEKEMQALKKTREETIRKAEELGIKYEAQYKGCAQCTFLAVFDALRWAGLELMPEAMEEKLYPGISMLTAGVCMTGEGTCGAVNSAVMAMGLALGVSRENADVGAARQAAATIRRTLLADIYRQYGSILCKDVQRKYFGKAWDLANDDMAHEFLGLTRGCIIMQTAQSTVGLILDEYEKSNVRISP